MIYIYSAVVNKYQICRQVRGTVYTLAYWTKKSIWLTLREDSSDSSMDFWTNTRFDGLQSYCDSITRSSTTPCKAIYS